jgi:hypothetical protein
VAPSEDRPVWLSGAILTLLNKLVFPVLWLGGGSGFLFWVYLRNGRIAIEPGFRLIVGFALLATVFLVWFAARLYRVGYAGSDLVVSDYFREARIPFDQIEAVEPVWWYRRRMVRIIFRQETLFGDTIYYLPKWGPLRGLFTAPEEELRDLISAARRSGLQ